MIPPRRVALSPATSEALGLATSTGLAEVADVRELVVTDRARCGEAHRMDGVDVVRV
ncbi:hypothetical protein [Ilumatobacter sp.]|uniref:hypothetical protein n=1 Tax=Ilumatobacter sp. TaxID=1967498 RepID=UPI003B5229B4